MARTRSPGKRPRRPLTRDRILRAAIQLLDESGLEAISMRSLGAALSAGTMSLYNHVASKEELLASLADLVAREIHVPTPGADWRVAMRQRAISAREVILRHPWAARLLESQTRLGETRLAALEAVFGCLRRAGFTVVAAYRAVLLFDSYVYGFTLQETAWSFDPDAPAEAAASFSSEVALQASPHMAEVLAHFTGPDGPAAGPGTMAREFEFGLDRILDAMASLRDEG